MKSHDVSDKLLLIDDDPDTLEYLSSFLKMEGHRVITASDAREGWAQFRHWKPALVITDLKMPGPHGTELIYDILEAMPDAAIIAISGGYFRADRQLDMANSLGAKMVLQKPISGNEIINAVDVVLSMSHANS